MAEIAHYNTTRNKTTYLVTPKPTRNDLTNSWHFENPNFYSNRTLHKKVFYLLKVVKCYCQISVWKLRHTKSASRIYRPREHDGSKLIQSYQFLALKTEIVGKMSSMIIVSLSVDKEQTTLS